MLFNVSYNQISNNGIDTAAVNEVAKQIFQRANAQESALANVDLTKFNRVSLGADLYSGKTSSDVARQIALNNSGMQVQLNSNALNSLKYLSSEASKNVFKSVDGKVAIAQTSDILEKQQQVKTAYPVFGSLVETQFDSEGDDSDSPAYYKKEESKKEEEISEDSLNILA